MCIRDRYLSVRNAFNNQGGNSISTLVFSLIRNAGNSRLQMCIRDRS